MKEKEFLDWLIKSGQQENSARSVLSRVKRVEEVYPDLDSRIEDNSIEALLNVFIYTKKDEAKMRIPLHKIEIEGNPYTGTQSLRTALAQYIEFRRSYRVNISESDDSKTQDTESNLIPIPYESIYKGDEFKKWLPENGVPSVKQYISYLRRLGGFLTIKANGVSALEYASRLMAEDKQPLAFELLEKLEYKLSALLSSASVPSEWRHNISDWRSGLRKYVDFLHDDSEDIPDEEEFEEANTLIPAVEVVEGDIEDSDNGEKISYSVEELKKNFAFRLTTQNRMSNDKDIYYPISIIRKLFCFSQRNGKKTSTPNNDYEWFKNWVDDYTGEIKVIISDKGDKSYPLSDVTSLLLYPATDNVYVQLSNTNGDIPVYTQTHDGNTELMKAQSLRTIHIDHTPLMAQVLSDNIAFTPAIDVLSNEIKSIAKAKRIDVKPKNFGKISKILFTDAEYVNSHLVPLIPALKNDLNILRKKCTLTLMQASHNLRKK